MLRGAEVWWGYRAKIGAMEFRPNPKLINRQGAKNARRVAYSGENRRNL